MHSRIEEYIFTDANVTASVNPDPPQHNDGGRQALIQVRCERSIGIKAGQAFPQRSRSPQKPGEQVAQETLDAALDPDSPLTMGEVEKSCHPWSLSMASSSGSRDSGRSGNAAFVGGPY